MAELAEVYLVQRTHKPHGPEKKTGAVWIDLNYFSTLAGAQDAVKEYSAANHDKCYRAVIRNDVVTYSPDCLRFTEEGF